MGTAKQRKERRSCSVHPGTGSPRSILHGAARPLCSLQECRSWGGKARTGFRAARGQTYIYLKGCRSLKSRTTSPGIHLLCLMGYCGQKISEQHLETTAHKAASFPFVPSTLQEVIFSVLFDIAVYVCMLVTWSERCWEAAASPSRVPLTVLQQHLNHRGLALGIPHNCFKGTGLLQR